SRDLADVDEILGKDPPRLADQVRALGLDRDRRDVLQVRRDAADVDRAAEPPADPLLEDRSAALEGDLQERLVLGESQGHDVAVDADRTARLDERLPRPGSCAAM